MGAVQQITVAELIQQRNQLQTDIYRAVVPLLKSFEETTGISPSAILLGMSDITTHADTHSRFLLTGVKVYLSIECIQ